MYIYIHIFTCVYIYIYIYTHRTNANSNHRTLGLHQHAGLCRRGADGAIRESSSRVGS